MDGADLAGLVARALALDGVRRRTSCDVSGHDLGVRWPLNTRDQQRRPALRRPDLNPANPTMNMSIGSSTYDGINFGVRRRMDQGIQLNAWYTLSKADRPRRARRRRADHQPGAGLDQPVCRRAVRPSARTDARHKVTISAIIQAPWGFRSRRSSATARRCRSTSGTATTTTWTASATTSTRRPTSTPARRCGGRRRSRRSARATTINCGRGAALSQLNLRVSKGFRARPRDARRRLRRGLQPVQRDQPGVPGRRGLGDPVLHGHARQPHANTVFMKPTAFAGDAGQPEQRVGQIGFRFTF